MINKKKNILNRLDEVEKKLEQLNKVTRKPSKVKNYFTSALVIEKLWRLIKTYFIEPDL